MSSAIFKTSSTEVFTLKGTASEKHLRAALMWLQITGLIFPSLSFAQKYNYKH